MAYSALTERLISIKKLSGKAHTSNNKGLINEGKPSGLTVSFNTVFGEPIPVGADPGSDALFDILTGSGITGNGQVEYLRFEVDFIAGTVDDAGGRQGFQLKLPANYDSDSKNPLAGTYPYQAGQVVNITSGALQMVPPSFAVGYEARPYYGGTDAKDSGTRVFIGDDRDWYLDYFNGVFFQQDPPGAGDDPENPDYIQGYLYIGKYLNEAISGGGGGTPAGSNTQIQFNNAGSFGASSNFTFNDSTSTMKVTNLSGSLTQLADGSSYLVAGSNITITSSSNGSVTIAGGNSFARQKVTEVYDAETPANQNVTVTSLDMSVAGFDPNYIDVFVNGQILRSGTVSQTLNHEVDYTATGNDTLKFSFDIEIDDTISVLVFPKD